MVRNRSLTAAGAIRSRSSRRPVDVSITYRGPDGIPRPFADQGIVLERRSAGIMLCFRGPAQAEVSPIAPFKTTSRTRFVARE